MPIKSARWMHDYLDETDGDFIESFDFFTSDWIKTGMKEERLTYRHWFNERRRKGLFYASLAAQRALGLQRAPPEDIEVMIGSQWWCLRRATLERVLAFLEERPDVTAFFRTTWIPDETFFQTMVRHLVPRSEIDPRTLTFLMFTDYGLPATFYNDHYDLLLSQDFLFARKISPEALTLKRRLAELWVSGETDFPIAGDGRRLFSFLTQRGREGRRFATRFWEREGTLGRDRELIVLVCKKWHVAKRLAAALRDHQVMPAIGYLFDEEQTELPDLGGIETGREKRERHRRALLRMLFRRMGADRLALCLDPAGYDLLADLYRDRTTIRTLVIECDYDDAYLEGHAGRIGLIGDRTPRSTVARLMPTVAQDFETEIQRIREGELPGVFRIREGAPEEAMAATMAEVFACDLETAGVLARTPHLFAD